MRAVHDKVQYWRRGLVRLGRKDTLLGTIKQRACRACTWMEDRWGQKVGNIVFTMLVLLAVPQILFGTAQEAWMLAPLMRWVCEANGYICREDTPSHSPGLKVANFDEYLARIRADIVRNREIRTSEDGQNA